jgi:hypothetical protein
MERKGATGLAKGARGRALWRPEGVNSHFGCAITQVWCQMVKLVPLLMAAMNLVAASQLLSQAPPVAKAAPVYAWGTVGLGAGSEGFAAMVGLDLEVQRNLISVRTTGVARLFENSLQDVALLYGRVYRGKQGMVAASIGVSAMNGDLCTGLFRPCTHLDSRFGLPLAVQTSWHTLRIIGLSLYGFANFNNARSFGGLVAAVEVGRLR